MLPEAEKSTCALVTHFDNIGLSLDCPKVLPNLEPYLESSNVTSNMTVQSELTSSTCIVAMRIEDYETILISVCLLNVYSGPCLSDHSVGPTSSVSAKNLCCC